MKRGEAQLVSVLTKLGILGIIWGGVSVILPALGVKRFTAVNLLRELNSSLPWAVLCIGIMFFLLSVIVQVVAKRNLSDGDIETLSNDVKLLKNQAGKSEAECLAFLIEKKGVPEEQATVIVSKSFSES